MEKQKKDYFTTTEAAQRLCVSPDTVLKWVRAGKIASYRTPGGHARIPKEAVAGMLPRASESGASDGEEEGGAAALGYKYCWDFHSQDGTVKEECAECVAYRSRAMRCYEMRGLPERFGPLKLHCETDCTGCDFYRLVHGKTLSALVLCHGRQMLEMLSKEGPSEDIRFRIASSEYECAAMIEKFRPDYVVVDCGFGASRTRAICENLRKDERIPYTRIVLSSNRPGSREKEYCDSNAFGWISKPFTLKQLEEFILGAAGRFTERN